MTQPVAALALFLFLFPVTIKPETPQEQNPSEVMSVDRDMVPKDAKKAYEKGLKARKEGKCSQALPDLRKAVALYPKYGEAFNELGNCLLATGDPEAAEIALLKAIELNATIYPSINLADFYVKSAQYDKALAVIRHSIRENPVEGDLFFVLAQIYFAQGQLKQAEAAGVEAHSRLHRVPDVHLLLAKVYLALGNNSALLTQLETYLFENPDGPDSDEIRRNIQAVRRQP